MKPDIVLKRNYFELQTESLGEIYDVLDYCLFKFKALELPDKDNQNSVSCIKEGIYPFKKEIQKKRGKILRISNVPNRSGILMHVANYVWQLKGCIAPGKEYYDIDKDGLKDVTDSRNTMDMIYDLLPDEGLIEIKS